VNPFQVKEVYIDAATLVNETLNFTQAVLDTATAPKNVWRDTIFIPDGGFTRIYQRFGGGEIAWTGKTVFHCHFLDHEDQGMISAIMFGDPNLVATDSQTTDDSPTGTTSSDSPTGTTPSDSPTSTSSDSPSDSPTGTSSAQSNGKTLAAVFTLSTSLYMLMM
jgi:hypothetical protein